MDRRFRGRLILVLSASLLLIAGLFPATTGAAKGAAQDVIVVFDDDGVDSKGLTGKLAKRHGFTATHVYSQAVKGFAGSLSAAAVAALKRDPSVASVEADATVSLSDVDQPITDAALWGLDRIDEKFRNPLDGNYTYGPTGAGVTAYILDTGIRTTHADFGGRAFHGFDSIDGALPADDCHGHGTHVAGTVGGATHGVAKGIRLVAVRVLACNGQGTWSGIIAGIDWVTRDHAAGTAAVANMSISGPASSAVDTAVSNSIKDGVSYTIAAGNGNIFGFAQDACRVSPARVTAAMTISATDNADRKPYWANYGSCVDWFAPGVGVKSAYRTSDTATATMSGTSMAAPHTAGVAALFLQTTPGATPQQVRDAIFAATTRAIVSNSRTTNNHLLCSRFPACPN